MDMKENDLMIYACEKFEEQKYDEALEAFVLLYGKGYEREWIKENIYQCYVNGNEGEFQKTYDECIKSVPVAYEQCILDFIPYKEGEYYIYDKQMEEFIGVFSMNDLRAAQPDELLQKSEFDASAVVINWDWRKLFHILVKMDKRKLYAVSHDIARCASFFKVPELAEYMKNVWVFESFEDMQGYFHEHTGEYLPRIWYGSLEDQDKFSSIVEEEHRYRLTPEGRSTENVLLTIAIPSFHRGHLLLKRIKHLCESQYDAEIEFAVSKNGTGVYQEEYDRVSKIEDARLRYYDHGKDLRYEINWHYTVEMAHGKYVLFVSDEDDVVLGALDHYFRLFSDYPDVSLFSAKSEFQGVSITTREYGEKGLDAFKCCFLRQNYLSGLIVRRADFIDLDLLKLEKYSNNAFYQNYPHEWWCVLMCQRGGYLREPVVLIAEQDYLAEIEAGYAQKSENSHFLPPYATYEARLQQLRGEIEFLNIFMKDDPDFLEQGMARVMGKIDYLFGIARYRQYDLEHYEARINEYGEICIEAIEKFPLDSARKKKLLIYLKNCCIELLNEHITLREREQAGI